MCTMPMETEARAAFSLPSNSVSTWGIGPIASSGIDLDISS